MTDQEKKHSNKEEEEEEDVFLLRQSKRTLSVDYGGRVVEGSSADDAHHHDGVSLKHVIQTLLLMTANNDIKHVVWIDFPWHQSAYVQAVQNILQQRKFESMTIAMLGGKTTNSMNIMNSETNNSPKQQQQQQQRPSLPALDWGQTPKICLRKIWYIGSQFQLGPGIHTWQVLQSYLDVQACQDMGRVLIRQQSLASSLLTHLELRGCRLASVEAFATVGGGLEKHASSLTYLGLAHCNLTDASLATLLQHCPPHLQELDLTFNTCGPDTLRELIRILSSSSSSSTSSQVPPLVKLIMDHCQYSTIDDTDPDRYTNAWGNELFSNLCQALQTNTTLKELHWNHNELKDEHVNILITKALAHKNTSLRILHLSYNHLFQNQQMMKEWISRLQSLVGLQECHMLGHDHHDDTTTTVRSKPILFPMALQCLADAIPHNHTLTELNVIDDASVIDNDDAFDGQSRLALGKMKYYLDLNWGGFYKLCHIMENNNKSNGESHQRPFPSAVWVKVLERANHHLSHKKRRRSSPDIIYSFLRHGLLRK